MKKYENSSVDKYILLPESIYDKYNLKYADGSKMNPFFLGKPPIFCPQSTESPPIFAFFIVGTNRLVILSKDSIESDWKEIAFEAIPLGYLYRILWEIGVQSNFIERVFGHQ